MRDAHPSLGRPRFFQGRKIRGSPVEDLAWFRPDGEPMTDEEWEEGWARAIAMRLGGKALTEVDAEGNRLVDDDLFLLLNGHVEPVLSACRRKATTSGRSWSTPPAARSTPTAAGAPSSPGEFRAPRALVVAAAASQS